MRAPALSLALLALASSAKERHWEYLGVRADGIHVFIDPGSLQSERINNKEYRSAWFKGERSEARRVFMALCAFDCTAETSASLNYTEYADDGTVKYTEELPRSRGSFERAFKVVVPDTTGEIMLERACRPTGKPDGGG